MQTIYDRTYQVIQLLIVASIWYLLVHLDAQRRAVLPGAALHPRLGS